MFKGNLKFEDGIIYESEYLEFQEICKFSKYVANKFNLQPR